jgi:hypothetical protein
MYTIGDEMKTLRVTKNLYLLHAAENTANDKWQTFTRTICTKLTGKLFSNFSFDLAAHKAMFQIMCPLKYKKYTFPQIM